MNHLYLSGLRLFMRANPTCAESDAWTSAEICAQIGKDIIDGLLKSHFGGGLARLSVEFTR